MIWFGLVLVSGGTPNLAPVVSLKGFDARVSLGKGGDLVPEYFSSDTGIIACISSFVLFSKVLVVICRSGPYFQQGCRIQSQKAQRPTFCGRQGQGAKLASSLRSLAFKKKLMLARNLSGFCDT